jgi:hypothetical protein
MQEEHFESLVSRVAERVPTVKEEIRKAFEAVRDNGELLTLARDEVRLLFDYRLWKASPNATSGVFHWKKPPTKILEGEQS